MYLRVDKFVRISETFIEGEELRDLCGVFFLVIWTFKQEIMPIFVQSRRGGANRARVLATKSLLIYNKAIRRAQSGA